MPLLLTSLAAALAEAAAVNSNLQQLPGLLLWFFRAVSDSAGGKRQLAA